MASQLKPHHTLFFGIKEITSLLLRLKQKMKDRFFWSKQDAWEAKYYLEYTKNYLKKHKPKKYLEIFGRNNNNLKVRRFKSSTTFNTVNNENYFFKNN